MRHLLGGVFAGLALLAVAADPPAESNKSIPPQPSREPPNLPGPFHPYNVTGPHKDHYHCLVSEHGLDPLVLVFARDLEVGEPMKALLSNLDTAIDQNPNARLAACVVFLPESLPEAIGTTDKNDDEREALAQKVADIAEGLKLKHVVLCLDSKRDVEKYRLDDEAAVTVILCNKYQVLSRHSLAMDKMTDEAVKQIMAEVASKLGAKRQAKKMKDEG
jgi:hypothetical protein